VNRTDDQVVCARVVARRKRATGLPWLFEGTWVGRDPAALGQLAIDAAQLGGLAFQAAGR
jgi:hypothetical protein